MACLMAGRLGCGGGPGLLFFPFCLVETAGLQEGVGDHRHQRVAVQARPGATLEVVEAELFLELLMRLLADPACLDRSCDLFEQRVGGQVGEIIFAFAGRAMLADHPDLLAGQMLGAHVVDALGWTVCNPNTDSGEAR